MPKLLSSMKYRKGSLSVVTMLSEAQNPLAATLLSPPNAAAIAPCQAVSPSTWLRYWTDCAQPTAGVYWAPTLPEVGKMVMPATGFVAWRRGMLNITPTSRPRLGPAARAMPAARASLGARPQASAKGRER